jgi:hypothetical protein
MSELHTASCCEETYSSAGQSSIARASFGVRLWLRRINLGLEKGEAGFHIDPGKAGAVEVGDSTETTTDVIACTAKGSRSNRVLWTSADPARLLKALLTSRPDPPCLIAKGSRASAGRRAKSLVAAKMLVEFESGECPYSEAIAAGLRVVPLPAPPLVPCPRLLGQLNL